MVIKEEGAGREVRDAWWVRSLGWWIGYMHAYVERQWDIENLNYILRYRYNNDAFTVYSHHPVSFSHPFPFHIPSSAKPYIHKSSLPNAQLPILTFHILMNEKRTQTANVYPSNQYPLPRTQIPDIPSLPQYMHHTVGILTDCMTCSRRVLGVLNWYRLYAAYIHQAKKSSVSRLDERPDGMENDRPGRMRDVVIGVLI